MLQNNFTFNSPEKITTNKTALISDDKFINLINNLSDLIKDYYFTNKTNINSLYNIITENSEKNIQEIIPNLFSAIETQKDYLNNFIEKAKNIFRKMRIYKNNKNSAINNSTSTNQKNTSNLNNIIKIYDYNSVNKKLKSNTNNKNVIELKITSKFKTEDDNNKIINNTYNAYNTNIYNKTDKKFFSNISTNIEDIKNLVNKLSIYENIISKVSLKYKDNFIQLENDILFLLDKCINDRGRFSIRNNSSFYNEINNISNNSYNYNNISSGLNMDIPNKNLMNEFNTKKELDNFNNNIIIKELKMKNNLYKNKVKDMEFKMDDLKSTIQVLEDTLEDSNNQINLIKMKKSNSYENSNQNYNKEIIKLKTSIKNNEILIQNLKKEIKGKENDLIVKNIKLNDALKEIENMNKIKSEQIEINKKEMMNNIEIKR